VVVTYVTRPAVGRCAAAVSERSGFTNIMEHCEQPWTEVMQGAGLAFHSHDMPTINTADAAAQLPRRSPHM
jgi:hypothetical protein